MSRRLAVILTVTAVGLMVLWNFVPADVAYRGDTFRCWPASVDRSSPASQVADRMLACRPVAARREQQGIVGLVVALLLIWGTYALMCRRRQPNDSAEDR